MMTKRWSVVAAVGLSLFAACDQGGAPPLGGVLGGGQAPGAAPATPAVAPATPATAGATAGTPTTAAGSPTTGAAATPTPDVGAADTGAVTADEDVDPGTAAEEATGDEEAEGRGDFAEPGGHFTVAFPSEPIVAEETTKSASGTMRIKTFTAARGDVRMVVSMGAVALKRGRRIDVRRLVTEIRDDNLARLEVARKEEHAFETSGLPGLAVSYLGASGDVEVRGVMHIIVRREPLTMYVAHAMAPPTTDEASLRVLVESFEPAATVSRMDEVLARATERSTGERAAARSSPQGGTATYRWSSVRTSGPRACVFFAGPVSRASRRSYSGGSGTWALSGGRARFELGGAVDFSGTIKRGKVNVKSVERATLTGRPYTFTETITGRLDEDGRFRGTYRYSDCRTDGSERCPGPCTIRATLTGTP